MTLIKLENIPYIRDALWMIVEVKNGIITAICGEDHFSTTDLEQAEEHWHQYHNPW